MTDPVTITMSSPVGGALTVYGLSDDGALVLHVNRSGTLELDLAELYAALLVATERRWSPVDGMMDAGQHRVNLARRFLAERPKGAPDPRGRFLFEQYPDG